KGRCPASGYQSSYSPGFVAARSRPMTARPLPRRWTAFWLGAAAIALACGAQMAPSLSTGGAASRRSRSARRAPSVGAQICGETGRAGVTSECVVGVAGAGAWGMALANAAAAAGNSVVLWGRDAERMAALEATRLSDKLPGAPLSGRVFPTADLCALARCGAILVATPAQATREAAGRLAAIPGSAPLVTCAKGIERGSHAFMTEVLRQAAPGRAVAILSGPSFAADVAAGLPTAVTLACADEALARSLCRLMHGPNLRLYHSTDVRGVEIGGAAKNVLAIACGVAAGRGLG